jgi:uncharacterized membrane protein YeaQ/YmgE (transglycosylase-associated protein family)
VRHESRVIAIVVGLLAGWGAASLVKDSSYGMIANLGLGLAGGLVAVILVQAVGVSVEAGWFAMTLVSLVGALTFIGAQRRFWSRPGSGTAVRRMRF